MTLQQDFPFYIRIPESLPPTIALEKGGRSHLKISLHLTAHCDFSWYQVRVDCYGLHQGQKVLTPSFHPSSSHINPPFLGDSSDATNLPLFPPPPK